MSFFTLDRTFRFFFLLTIWIIVNVEVWR